MIDIAEIERLNLKKEASLQRLDALLAEVASYAETRSAVEIAQLLEEKRKADPSLRDNLSSFIEKFRILTLPLLKDDEVLQAFSSIGAAIADERVSVYERLRARLIVMPPSRREAFCSRLIEALRRSGETFVGATVGSWVKRFEDAGGASDPTSFFSSPQLKGLDEVSDHSVRHLCHIITLAANPGSIEARPLPQTAPLQPARPVTPPVPKNLPVKPEQPVLRPVVPEQTVARTPVPMRPAPPVPASAPLQPPSQQPKPVPQSAPSPDRGPSLAAVLARLQQSGEVAVAEPPTVAHLTPEDHEEIIGHEEKLGQFDVGPNVHDTLADEIEKIIARHHLTFEDEHLKLRFVSIITSRLKDIRTSSDTLDLLTRSTKVGGMGLDPGRAQAVVDAASTVASSFHDEGAVKKIAAEQEKAMAAPLPKPPKVPEVPQAEMPPAAPPPPAAAGVPVVPSVPLARPVEPLHASSPQPMRQSPVVTATVPPMPTASLRQAVSERQTVSDIRGSSRLVGPIEELKAMSLVDYRRLGPDAVACVRRVYEKIQRLGKESFTKKAEGIRAWRASEVHQLYVAMGQESLVAGRSVREILMNRRQAGEPALTEEEFNLVADLNKKLRF